MLQDTFIYRARLCHVIPHDTAEHAQCILPTIMILEIKVIHPWLFSIPVWLGCLGLEMRMILTLLRLESTLQSS
jgi:hypothetical protein